METIRSGAFETNSSSTHSITISTYQKPREDNIPRNLTRDTGKTFLVAEMGDCGGSDETYACDTHRTEIEKLRFVINMIATLMDAENDDGIYWDFNRRAEKGYNEKCFEEMVHDKYFQWLTEAILEETGTMIEYKRPEDISWFPFFDTTSDENNGIDALLHAEDKEHFKKTVKNIIFNKDVIIENEVCPYGMERW